MGVNRMKKLSVLGIIALFIGLAFIPSFNAVSIKEEISEDDETLEIYDYLTVKWKNRFLYMTMIIRNNLNRSVSNVSWKYEIVNHSGFGPFFEWYVDYPTKPITGSQEILKPFGEIRVRINVNGYGLMWNLFQVKYDDYWGSPTLDIVRYSFIFGPFILWVGMF
jgi:hypothetical protein